jgi:hypothetical protein
MKLVKLLIPLLGASSFLAGCGAPQPQGVASMVPQDPDFKRGLHPHGHSWMDPAATTQDLVYVSNADGEVTVYRYWQHTLVGVLTNFTQPMGQCADSAGDVFITDYAAEEIFEYAHGGTQPIETLNDSPNEPYACSVDPTTGNLAVANDNGSSEGNIVIWPKGSGGPTTFTDSVLYNFQGCAYDGSGDLLVSNGNPGDSKPASFAWLPRGGTSLINIAVPGPQAGWAWDYVVGLEWDGKYFGIDRGDIYQISVIHGQAYYVATTELTGTGDAQGPIAIYNDKPGEQGTQAVGGGANDDGSFVDYWHYPSGGNDIYDITHGVDRPTGVAISLQGN